MNKAHRELIAETLELRKLLYLNDAALLYIALHQDPDKMTDAFSLPGSNRERLADSYREIVKARIKYCIEKRVAFVEGWKCARQCKRALVLCIPMVAAIVLNGITRSKYSWRFDESIVFDEHALWFIIVVLAVVTIPLKPLALRLIGRSIDRMSIFAFLMTIVCLIEIAALF